MYLARSNQAKNTAGGVYLVLAQNGEQWVNYLARYSETVQELMKLTPNKRRFYQLGMRAATLMKSTS